MALLLRPSTPAQSRAHRERRPTLVSNSSEPVAEPLVGHDPPVADVSGPQAQRSMSIVSLASSNSSSPTSWPKSRQPSFLLSTASSSATLGPELDNCDSTLLSFEVSRNAAQDPKDDNSLRSARMHASEPSPASSTPDLTDVASDPSSPLCPTPRVSIAEWRDASSAKSRTREHAFGTRSPIVNAEHCNAELQRGSDRTLRPPSHVSIPEKQGISAASRVLEPQAPKQSLHADEGSDSVLQNASSARIWLDPLLGSSSYCSRSTAMVSIAEWQNACRTSVSNQATPRTNDTLRPPRNVSPAKMSPPEPVPDAALDSSASLCPTPRVSIAAWRHASPARTCTRPSTPADVANIPCVSHSPSLANTGLLDPGPDVASDPSRPLCPTPRVSIAEWRSASPSKISNHASACPKPTAGDTFRSSCSASPATIRPFDPSNAMCPTPRASIAEWRDASPARNRKPPSEPPVNFPSVTPLDPVYDADYGRDSSLCPTPRVSIADWRSASPAKISKQVTTTPRAGHTLRPSRKPEPVPDAALDSSASLCPTPRVSIAAWRHASPARTCTRPSTPADVANIPCVSHSPSLANTGLLDPGPDVASDPSRPLCPTPRVSIAEWRSASPSKISNHASACPKPTAGDTFRSSCSASPATIRPFDPSNRLCPTPRASIAEWRDASPARNRKPPSEPPVDFPSVTPLDPVYDADYGRDSSLCPTPRVSIADWRSASPAKISKQVTTTPRAGHTLRPSRKPEPVPDAALDSSASLCPTPRVSIAAWRHASPARTCTRPSTPADVANIPCVSHSPSLANTGLLDPGPDVASDPSRPLCPTPRVSIAEWRSASPSKISNHASACPKPTAGDTFRSSCSASPATIRPFDPSNAMCPTPRASIAEWRDASPARNRKPPSEPPVNFPSVTPLDPVYDADYGRDSSLCPTPRVSIADWRSASPAKISKQVTTTPRAGHTLRPSRKPEPVPDAALDSSASLCPTPRVSIAAWRHASPARTCTRPSTPADVANIPCVSHSPSLANTGLLDPGPDVASDPSRPLCPTPRVSIAEWRSASPSKISNHASACPKPTAGDTFRSSCSASPATIRPFDPSNRLCPTPRGSIAEPRRSAAQSPDASSEHTAAPQPDALGPPTSSLRTRRGALWLAVAVPEQCPAGPSTKRSWRTSLSPKSFSPKSLPPTSLLSPLRAPHKASPPRPALGETPVSSAEPSISPHRAACGYKAWPAAAGAPVVSGVKGCQFQLQPRLQPWSEQHTPEQGSPWVVVCHKG